MDDALDGDVTGDGGGGPRVRSAARPTIRSSGKCCGCLKRCAPSNCKCWRIRKEPCDGTCKPGETRKCLMTERYVDYLKEAKGLEETGTTGRQVPVSSRPLASFR